MKRLLTLILTGTMLAGSAAFAQSDYRRDRDPAPMPQVRHDDNRVQDRNDHGRADWEHARWSRGDRLPPEFRDRDHIVMDWRGNHLRRPPAGYEWVRAGDRFILVSTRNGIIAELAELR